MCELANNYLTGIPSLSGKHVTLIGLGLFGGGVEAVRFLTGRGAHVTVTDLKSEKSLRKSIEKLEGLDVTFHLGGHREDDFTNTDLVLVSPAVPKDSPYLKLAESKGVPFETEMNLFFKLCRGRLIGVTGSNGKTTTAAILGAMMKRAFPEARLGGNLGRSLLAEAESINPGTPVVLELSSFQLEDLGFIDRGPEFAVVTNLTPNHLDRHGTFEEYVNAKKAVFRYQSPRGVTILNADCPATRALQSEAPGKVIRFSMQERITIGAFLDGDNLVLVNDSGEEKICRVGEVQISGEFNIANILAASAMARELGVSTEDIRKVACDFRGVPHRLELLGTYQSVRVYNDSISTSPVSTIGALRAIPGGKVLIAGGSDKGLDYSGLAEVVKELGVKVVTMGAIGSIIAGALRDAGTMAAAEVETLAEATTAAFNIAGEGDAILLSPATASYDQFENFEHRGKEFKRLLQEFS